VGYVLGIDVGASRTSAALTRSGSEEIETVDLDDGDGVASVLHLGADGTLDVGAAAEQWASSEPERVVSGFSRRIGDASPMLLAGDPWAPEELTAWLVRWVVGQVAEREGGSAARIAVTHPVSWDADRTRLLAAALAEQDLDVTFVATAQAVVLQHATAEGIAPGSAVTVHDVDSGDAAVLRVAADGALPRC
jgi:molecular chaperone DnaK (HSP70)